jgi:hypothetical protein
MGVMFCRRISCYSWRVFYPILGQGLDIVGAWMGNNPQEEQGFGIKAAFAGNTFGN